MKSIEGKSLNENRNYGIDWKKYQKIQYRS